MTDPMTTTARVDVLTPALYGDGAPYEQFAWLRANAPVYDHVVDDPNLIERCWVLSRHDDVRAVSRDPEFLLHLLYQIAGCTATEGGPTSRRTRAGRRFSRRDQYRRRRCTAHDRGNG